MTAKEVRAIQKRMEELVDADLPFVPEGLSKEEAIALFQKTGREDKIALLGENPQTKKVRFYSLDGHRDFFYGRMVPSTGYIKLFQIIKYRRGVLVRFRIRATQTASRIMWMKRCCTGRSASRAAGANSWGSTMPLT